MNEFRSTVRKEMCRYITINIKEDIDKDIYVRIRIKRIHKYMCMHIHSYMVTRSYAHTEIITRSHAHICIITHTDYTHVLKCVYIKDTEVYVNL